MSHAEHTRGAAAAPTSTATRRESARAPATVAATGHGPAESPIRTTRGSATAAPSRRVVVVGAGIAGLAAAYELRSRGCDPVVLEAAERLGGKIDASRVGPLIVDSGPDGFVARDQAAAELCQRLGLGSDLVEPRARHAYVLAQGALQPLPRPSVLGVPVSAEALEPAGVISDAGMAALRHGLAAAADPLDGDTCVGDVLRPRVGDEVFELLVDPLLGGINAGSADEMSITACAAPLWEAVRRGGPLGPALQQTAARSSTAPVFQSVRGGVARMIEALATELGDAVRPATPAQSLRRAGTARWVVSTPAGPIDADGVILACPAPDSARLLAPVVSDAAGLLAEIEYASVVLVTFVIRRELLRRPLDASGYLVPRREGLLTTACSWSSSKWDHYRCDDVAVLRVSAGRIDDRRWLDLEPAELVSVLADELATTGVLERRDAAEGRFEARVTPWHRSLPQYRAGHLERVGALQSALGAEAPTLAVAGAALRGVGVPACVRSASAAAHAVDTASRETAR